MRPVDLHRAAAHWLTRDLLALPVHAMPEGVAAEDLTWTLGVAPGGGLSVHAPAPPVELTLALADGALPHPVAETFPHLAACHPLHLTGQDAAGAEELLTGQVVLLGRDVDGELAVATSLQVAGVLDDLYADRATRRSYGPTWTSDEDGTRTPTVTVWAPTAQHVDLLLWDSVPGPDRDRAWAPPGEPAVVAMTRGDDGCWTVTGTPEWADRCYLLELLHVIPRTGRRQKVRSTDPWSVGLTIDSTHSVLVDLQDPAWAPEVWRSAPVPTAIRAVDQTIYELHVRDFSRDDEEVPEQLRGTYLGFGPDGAGRRHLAALAEAGLTTVHLLPVFDLTSVEEDPALRDAPDRDELRWLSDQDPAGTRQQVLVARTADRDAFNWGYDPWHFMAPEGSYTTSAGEAHGGRRVAQCRTMVGDLHRLGLRVVLDQVYNHTTDSGLHRASVLDRIVPGYYHRLDRDGWVATSTCCQGLATEHAMGQRLMVDGCVLWARHYRVDGFRFDLMGHHSRANLEAVRAALDELTPERDGVDGRAVHLYGEGWNFGEVAGNARFYQATQGQLSGTGVGTFNDRLRDAVRGHVHDDDPRSGRGLGTGGASPHDTDLLQVGLAGGLAGVRFLSQESGQPVTGAGVAYGSAPAGYATSPEEVVNYVDAHDNETLWDTLLLKLPQETPMAERVRRNTLALATVTLSQGISFWHAGTEVLRSKSLDRNSFDSGDWFNHLDYSLRDNGFGRGLPPEPDNGRRWPVLAPLLGDPALRPSTQDMRLARDCALDLLRIRRDLPLLRLGSSGRVLDKVSFPVSGTEHGRPDVVVMLVDDTAGEQVDPLLSGVLVVLNLSSGPVRQHVPWLAPERWRLCDVQRDGADPVVRGTTWDAQAGSVEVPALTAAVLVRPRG
ncbi:pullulanase-type alpha-1,6-glucosidase [Ornithinimicrobium avium]|uniref:Pullulanase-type alpha-1,6-glucosidase n=1 Tax=Ornithinimicrobium avium TaxID=2283195 RepID=A0A345NRD7_9MICO|nr:pullulanase-type alpha-1,6-glucosidase [Ornithinimicrobium avium]AXH97595.1 pullulanase-type alpha-1,6-glucosidase [Ornithinimicrobium avium]